MATNDPNDPTRPGTSEVHGTSTVTPVSKPVEKKTNWLPWLLLPLLLLALFFILRSCGDREEETTTTVTTTEEQTETPAVTATPALPVEQVTLPGGRTVELEPNTMNYSLQRYLASTEATPRRFTFDRLNFATASAELPGDASTTVNALGQIMAAYPNARVRIEGYADARGTDPANVQLGAQRAEAVARALIAQGVAASRVETATGGETNPVESNATAPGRAENRRTDLVVLAK